MQCVLAGPFDTAGQEGIIRQDRIDANQDTVVNGAQIVAVAASPFVGDPLGFPSPRGRAAIKALCQFDGNERLLDHHVLDEDFIELSRFFRHKADFDGDAGFTQDSRALTSH